MPGRRRIYTVAPHGSGGWIAAESGGGIVLLARTKTEAVKAAADLARRQDGAHVRVKRPDGSVQEETIYPRGSGS